MLWLNLKTKNKMAKQLIFKDKYVQKLKINLNVESYKANEFVYDKKQVLMLPNIDAVSDLVNKLDVKMILKQQLLYMKRLKN